jgi:hypothetical protein
MTHNQQMSTSDTAMNCLDITKDSVSGNRLIALLNITCRKMGTPMLYKSVRDTAACILGGNIECLPDCISWGPSN